MRSARRLAELSGGSLLLSRTHRHDLMLPFHGTVFGESNPAGLARFSRNGATTVEDQPVILSGLRHVLWRHLALLIAEMRDHVIRQRRNLDI